MASLQVTHQCVVCKNIALPHPAKTIRTAFSRDGDHEARNRHGGDGSTKNLLDSQPPIDMAKRVDSGIANDVRNVRISAPFRFMKAQGLKIKKAHF